MNERKQLEADYDKAMEDLDNAAADFANVIIGANLDTTHTDKSYATTDLRETVAILAKSQLDLPEARAILARTRANCHRKMLALEEFEHAKVNQWSTRSSEYRVRNVGQRQATKGHGEKFADSIPAPLRHNLLVPSGKPARALLVKHTVMLFALVLAFLQYYFLDAQLQIQRLPVSAAYLSSQQGNLIPSGPTPAQTTSGSLVNIASR